MRFLQDYDRKAAVLYAHAWAYGRNPAFYDYEQVGGDCTNFASQCIFAGCGIMNFTPTYGWYYITANQKAPAWTAFPGSGGHRHRPHIGKYAHCCPQLRCRQPPAVHLSVSGHSFSPYHRHHPSLKEIHNLFTSSPGQMVS